MTEPTTDGLSRRRFAALAVATASAGCLGGDDDPEPTARLDGDSQYITGVEFRPEEAFPSLTETALRVRLEHPDVGGQITHVALISPEGDQDSAKSVATGETSLTFERAFGDGTYEILALNGGELECSFGWCQHSGGTVLERVQVVISSAE